jgi:hypothetical protein
VDIDIKRLDHLGIISGVIKDLGLVNAIDKRLQKDTQGQENITPETSRDIERHRGSSLLINGYYSKSL